jgi:hypothetical protein
MDLRTPRVLEPRVSPHLAVLAARRRSAASSQVVASRRFWGPDEIANYQVPGSKTDPKLLQLPHGLVIGGRRLDVVTDVVDRSESSDPGAHG